MGKSSEFLGSSNSNPSDVAVPQSSSRNPFRRAMNALGGHSERSIGTDAYQPPPGPPPSHSGSNEKYQPPAGPPPTHHKESEYSNEKDPPPYDPWLSVPDNSTLGAPPSISYDTSPTSNAPAHLADSARAFTRANPLHAPRPLREGELAEIESGHLALTKPPQLRCSLKSSRPGTWQLSTTKGTEDVCLLTSLPMYAAAHHNPSTTGRPYTCYFEIKITKLDLSSSADREIDSSVSVGFLAPPYPPWRAPGWERASLGVHSDDGRRYVNDNRGGRDFTTAFSEGEVVGVGMKMAPPSYAGGRNRVEVFFTREGRRAGSWDLWEERDAAAEDDVGNPEGLGGDRDLLGAVGVYGAVEIEWRGRRDEWLYRPDLN